MSARRQPPRPGLPNGPGVSRRGLLHLGAAAAAGVFVGGNVLAACGGDDDDAGSSGAGTTAGGTGPRSRHDGGRGDGDHCGSRRVG